MAGEQKASRSIFEDAPGPGQSEEAASATCSCRAWWKVAVVIVLLAVVAGIIASKTRGGASSVQAPARVAEQQLAGSSAQPMAKPGAQADPEMVLATVNVEPITLARLQDVLQTLPDQYRTAFERSKHDLLEELITRELLLQEARRLKVDQTELSQAAGAAQRDVGDKEQAMIQALLRTEVLDRVEVTEEDLRAFYEAHRGELPDDPSFEEAKDMLLPYAEQDKQREAVELYVEDLRARATIVRNEAWVEQQKARAADNPLDRALGSGKPVLADFGRGVCIPCKIMKPILDDLKEEYAGRAEILIIEIDEYPAVTRRCGIRAIPTQIFYDAQGKEAYRHQGFMPREDIVAKLAEMGVR